MKCSAGKATTGCAAARTGRRSTAARTRHDNDVASFSDATPSAGHVAGFNGGGQPDPAVRPGGVEPHTAIGNGDDSVVEHRERHRLAVRRRDHRAVPRQKPDLYGGMGSDTCTPGRVSSRAVPDRAVRLPRQYPPFAIDDAARPGAIVVGGSTGETFGSPTGGTSFTVTAVGGTPEALATTGEACTTPTTGTVRCSLASTPAAAARRGSAAPAPTRSPTQAAAPNGITTDLDGGEDSDTITGSSGSETLYSG